MICISIFSKVAISDYVCKDYLKLLAAKKKLPKWMQVQELDVQVNQLASARLPGLKIYLQNLSLENKEILHSQEFI